MPYRDNYNDPFLLRSVAIFALPAELKCSVDALHTVIGRKDLERYSFFDHTDE